MTTAALPQTCSAASNRLWVWPAGAAYLGATPGLAAHAASVHCLVIGVDAAVTVQADGSEPVTARSVLIPPRTVMRLILPPDARALFCYADVTRARAADLSARMAGARPPLFTDHRDESDLIELCDRGLPDGYDIMKIVAAEPSPAIDPRISRTTERFAHDPAGRCAADVCADREGMSRSHFLRTFAAETGTSFRQYRLWMRMLHVARSVADGADLTRASADAGFASPSHFSDTFLRMFGMTATALLGLAGAPIVLGGRRAAAS
ncbi:helix-turn-helix transcriptional regulator [Millisia brevis]|uniref:helix-turn-helix transcriptional regulator n=1 Tax=Millisia brevis TaxID=264148 RepID=UPI000AA8684C|nr:helix-turn-helix transcriptional regulator [Millisia brevis]